MKLIVSQKDNLLEEEKIRADDKKSGKSRKEIANVETSFRKLELD